MKSYHALLLFLTTIALCVLSSHGEDELCEYMRSKGAYIKQACFPDKKGYHTCAGSNSFTATVCKAGRECRCHVDFWDEQLCTCEDSTPRPDFPATGVIRWTGKEEFDNDYRWDSWDRVARKSIYKHHNLRVAKLSGEVHLDSSGRWLHKETKVAKSGWNWRDGNKDPATMTTTVSMIIPNADGTFTRYEKQDNKECRKTTMQNAELSLTSIWMKKPPRGFDGYFKIVGRSKANENVESQEWNMFVQGDGWHDSWTWFVDYDKQKHHAIPTKQIDAPAGEWHRRKEYYYNYQPLKEGETSFDVTDFCS